MPRELGRVWTMPSMRTVPRSGGSNPATMFIKVDLPHPDGPTIATMSPSATSKLILSSTCNAPCSVAKLLPTPSTLIRGGMIGAPPEDAFLVDITPPDHFQAFQQAHHPVQQQADQADDDHAGDD